MSGGGTPDDKPHVGDETLQRIDDLAGGWSIPHRARKDGDDVAVTPAPAATRDRNAPPPIEVKASGSAPGAAERVRVSKKKKVRERTRAKGKERGKTAASRRGLDDASGEAMARALLGRELPPAAGPIVDRDLRSAEHAPLSSSLFPRIEGEATPAADGDTGGEPTADGADRSGTEVSDRALTRVMSERIGTEVSDRAATRLSDRAVTRLFPGLPEPGASDSEATLVFGERPGMEIDSRALGRGSIAPPVHDPAVDRHDETMLEVPGSGLYSVAADVARKTAAVTTAILRLPPTLPRRRGLVGDVVYLYTAFVGVARTRRELSAADRKLEAEKEARRRRLADLARLALADTTLASPTLARGREEIIELEDQRSRRAGAAAGCDADIAGLERELEEEQKRIGLELETLRRGSKEMLEKVEPLHRRLRAAVRRGNRLQESLSELDRKLTRQRNRLGKLSPDRVPSAEAHLASLLAERRAMALEEPIVAAEIDDLEPAIASLIAARNEAGVRAARLEREREEAVARTAEKVAAARARRVVDERAEAELAQAQEDALRALGERLGVERPPELATRLRGIEEHEVAIATLERRQLELTELLTAVDRWTLARGILWLLALLVAVAAALVWSIPMRAA